MFLYNRNKSHGRIIFTKQIKKELIIVFQELSLLPAPPVKIIFLSDKYPLIFIDLVEISSSNTFVFSGVNRTKEEGY